MTKLALIISFLFCVACNNLHGDQSPSQFISNPDNRIKQSITIGEFQTTVQWMPPSLMEQANDRQTISSDDGMCYFNIRFDKATGSTLAADKNAYLNFDIQQDFVLLNGRDSIMPAICQRIVNGMPDSYQYIVAFDRAENVQSDFTLFYHDKVLGVGTQAFVYHMQDIRKIPEPKSVALQ